MTKVFAAAAVALIALTLALTLGGTSSASSDCTSDATAELDAAIDATPDGGTLTLDAGGCYLVSGTVVVRGRTGLTIDGNGATFRQDAATVSQPERPAIRIYDGSGFVLRNLSISGNNSNCDVLVSGNFADTHQWQHGVDLRGVKGATIDNVHVDHVYGDFVYVGLSSTNQTATGWSEDVTITGSSGSCSGRMGVAVVAGRNVTVDGGYWEYDGIWAFDVEPNGSRNRTTGVYNDGAENVHFQNNTIGPRLAPARKAFGFIANSPLSNIFFENNTFTGQPLFGQFEGRGITTGAYVRGNVSSHALYSTTDPAIIADGINGLTVTGNTQSLASGQPFVTATNSVNVYVSGNNGEALQPPPETQPPPPPPTCKPRGKSGQCK